MSGPTTLVQVYSHASCDFSNADVRDAARLPYATGRVLTHARKSCLCWLDAREDHAQGRILIHLCIIGD
jgi:hypothetical protein